MRYLVVNPYGPAYGVTSYSRLIARILASRVDVDYVGNDQGMSFEVFRDHVSDYVRARYAPDDVVIETPEARAAALHLADEYRLHVRLHAAGAIGELGNGWPVDPDRLDTELGLVDRATVISASSYAVLDQMAGLMDTSPVHVFKNPADRTIRHLPPSRKDVDLLFMGRLERLKGADFLVPLLERLPASFRVVLIGPGVEAFRTPPSVRCHVEAGPAIVDHSRFELLARVRVFLMLSRFENCSLAVLESLAAGTLVVGWDVGGNAEIAPPPLIRLVPLGNLGALEAAVVDACQSPYPTPADFEGVTETLISDFERGWAGVWDRLTTGRQRPPFKGLSHRYSHVKHDPRLADGPTLVALADAYESALRDTS